MESWDKLPLDLMDDFAEMEKSRPDVYRPIYSLHKWWATRPGTTFRTIGLACLTDENTSKEDILRHTESGSKYDGRYFQSQGDEFEDVRVLDPFSGGGVTHVELNRLGADTIGYELNPVAWWCSKKSVEEVDIELLKQECENVISDVRAETEQYFKTTDPRYDEEAEVLYTMLTQKVGCLTCDEEFELHPRQALKKSKKTIPGAVHCPNDDCDDPVITLDEKISQSEGYRDIKDTEVCPSCGNEFDPMDGNYSSGYAKYTCPNGHKNDLKEYLQREDEKPTFVPFAIQYMSKDGEKRWKTPTEDDLGKISEAEQKLDLDELPIPQQQVPAGNTRNGTGVLQNYNYEYFHELFTPRQLLTYGRLLDRAKEVEDKDCRELIITAISTSLEYNSKLCKWHYGYGIAQPVFERKAYINKVQPVEGNPLNRQQNTVALDNFFDKIQDAKSYCEYPFEKVREEGGVTKYPINGESVDESRLESLHCKTAEQMDEESQSVDYIITDPPYYDNIQYSELSLFFYVWLREGLKDDYEVFEPEYVPRAREIVASSFADKDEEFFIEGLSNVFSECNRVLKSDGEMVFTYHHNDSEAWAVVLEALIKSGFTMTGAYPVLSELPNNPQISDIDNTEYDILIFCNKEEAEDEITLTELRSDLYFEIQDMIEQERERHDNLSPADLGVILRGKCMYYYSKHYPEVYSDGEQVTVDEALEAVDDIIEQVVEGSINLPHEIDNLSRSYALLSKQGAKSYDDLRKQLMSKGLNVRDLEDEQLVEGPRKEKRPVPEEERVQYIESKLGEQIPNEDSSNLLDIDKVHYLAHLYRTEQNTIEYLKAWKSDDLEELAEHISDATGDDTYERVMEMNLMQF